MTREEWLAKFAREVLGWHGSVLPSFPAARARGGRVCDIARDDSGEVVLMVSPTLADSLEVGVTLAYLVDRLSICRAGGRLTQRGARLLAVRGWRANGWVVDPNDWRAEQLAREVDQFVTDFGAYPSAPVTTSVRGSHARSGVLTLTCQQHGQVRAQQTRRQFADNPVHCHHCGGALVEVTR
jgi:hypothetical protein